MSNDFNKAFKDSLPVMAGYLVLGMGFGMVMKNAGYGILPCFLMSVFIYAGSMQYVSISLLTSGASLVATFVMTAVVNIRHLFYAISMLKRYGKIEKHKLYSIFALTDETFSIVVNREEESDEYLFFLSILNQSYWVIGSLIGSLLGNIIPFDTTGIEFSMTALFVTVVISKWEENRNRDVILAGFVFSILCLLIFNASDFLIPAIGLIIVYLLVRKKVAV